MNNVNILLSILKEEHIRLGPYTSRPILLMVSGGTDSALLPRIFSIANLGCPIHVFHVNYGLRGKDSDGDEEQVVAECNRLGLGHTVHRVRNMSRKNMEKEARDIRYSFVKNSFKDHIKVTAHHEEDQLETIITRFMRGCSVYGYAGIDRLRKDLVWRPFLNVKKEVITNATEELGIVPRIDHTNYDESITRNWIRHNYMPDNVCSEYADSLLRLSESCKELKELIDRLSKPIFDKVKADKGCILITYKDISRDALEDPLVSKRLRDLVWNSAGLKPWSDEQYTSAMNLIYGRGKGATNIGSGQVLSWQNGVATIRSS